MFTGIVEDVGELASLTRQGRAARLRAKSRLASSLSLGDSISVNGCCLTVIARESDNFEADLSEETLARTTFGTGKPGEALNLERPMAADGRFGGHIVQGHVDGVGTLARIEEVGDSRVMEIAADAPLMPFIAVKGSIAVAGVSLTVNLVRDRLFGVTLIPFTLAHTTLGRLGKGSGVNLEVDIVAKYVARAAEAYLPKEGPRA